MRRLTSVLGTIVLVGMVSALNPTSAPAADRHGRLQDRIDLPDGWQPEGITSHGKTLFTGSLANGAIWEADARTGEGEILSPGAAGNVAVGLDYDRRRDLIWAAGGGTNVVRVYDGDDGHVVATYDFPSDTPRFLNDLVVTRRAVYATDSFNQELCVIPLGRRHGGHGHGDVQNNGRGDHGHGRHLPPPSAATTLPLTGDVVFEDGFNLNGIASDRRLLITVQSNTGQLFRIDPRTGETFEIDLGGDLVTNGDGLELDGRTAYVVRNQNNLIAVVDLDRHGDSGEVVDELTAAGLDVPATATLVGGSLFAANARFTTPPTPTTPYWITRVAVD
jgi:sugar lactone lactonase YvrE